MLKAKFFSRTEEVKDVGSSTLCPGKLETTQGSILNVNILLKKVVYVVEKGSVSSGCFELVILRLSSFKC